MANILPLLTSKKSVLALLAMAAIVISENRDWLRSMDDTHVVCLTVIACVAIVMQGAVDIAEMWKGRTPSTRAGTKAK